MTYTELEQKLLNTGLVQKSDYLTKYCNLLLTNSLSTYDSSKANYHHAIPRLYFETHNLEIDNSNKNVFILLYKDHVLAHYYLAMAATNELFKYKMAYSVRFVIGQISNISEKELLEKLPEVQKSYEMIAKDFSVNNPSKKPANAEKISKARKGKIYVKKDNKSIVISPEDLDTYLADGWERGRIGNWTHEQKGKIGIIFNGSNKLVAKEDLQQYLDLGATVGHLPHKIKNKGNMGKMPPESRAKQAAARRNKIAIHSSSDCIILYIDPRDLEEYLAKGYCRGTGRKSPSVAGKILVNKNGKLKYIMPEQKNEYLKNGYSLGRK